MKGLLLGIVGIVLIVLLNVGQVEAEITVPYTVDEKAQVSFGDMTDTGGHNGLENYTHEYVDGYLHFTFTYTHHVSSFSSYPPKIYVTAEDPRNTALPTVRENQIIFQLLATTHPTDWYLYDVQFDATGYRVQVLEAGAIPLEDRHVSVIGLAATDYAALANDFLLAPASNFSMSFTPLSIQGEAAPASDTAQAAETPPHREGERGRCIETPTGTYCPNEEVRQSEIIRIMEFIIEKLEELIGLLKDIMGVQPSI
jgi:hypothetical protein